MFYITLCMIVKNESKTIEKCISSIYPYIDYYIISDTGSSDNTKEIIKTFFDNKNIHGEIHNDPWIDFGSNRTLAIDKCRKKTNWIIFIDADEWVEGKIDFSKLDNNIDGYTIDIGSDSFNNRRLQVLNLNTKNWIYKYPIHEIPLCEGYANTKHLDGDYRWYSATNGGRSNMFKRVTEKYFRDYLTIIDYIKSNGDDTRMQFYAAQSAFDAELYQLAEKEYLKRVAMGGWFQETFYSWYKIGICRKICGYSDGSIYEAFMNAYDIDPYRVEPLYELSEFLRIKGKSKSAFLYSITGSTIQMDLSKLFIHKDHYLWRIHDEVGSTAYYAGRMNEGKIACQKILSENHMPKEHTNRVKQNLNFYIK